MESQSITRFLKFPLQFKEDRLLHDFSLITDGKWTSHYNQAGYDGEWKIIPLYAQNGDGENVHAFSLDNSLPTETVLLKDCLYFKEVIDSFKFPILSARILRLGVGAEIKPHRDHELGYEDNCFRLHIPIITNKDVSFILDDTQLQMMPGECWYTNVNYVHSVANRGTEDRIHLVIDGQRNEWSDDLFFSMAARESFRPIPKEEESLETTRLMIEQLKLTNLPATESLIKELEEKLK